VRRTSQNSLAGNKLSNVTTLFSQAMALHQAGRLVDAEKSYRRILAAEPDHSDTLHLLGVIFHQRGHHDLAIQQIELALQRNPNDTFALNNRGLALRALRRSEEALASFNRALALRPDYAEALSNRGLALHDLDRLEEALESFNRALALRPDYAEAQLNRGVILRALQRFDEALASYDRALALRPDYAEALSNRGWTLHQLNRFGEALASYERAVALRPDYAEAHYNEALCRLLIGDFDRGWQKHEWRWQTQHLGEAKRSFTPPLWTGREDIAGKNILLHAEQGFGDTIQFCRYVPLVAARGARVILEVQRSLQALVRSLSGAAQVLSQGDPLPDFDCHCPLLSLPLAFDTRVETIPSATPYLAAPAAKVTAWRNRLGSQQKPRIGLVWAGNPRKPNATQRNIAFDRLAPLLQITDCEFYSLQKGEDAVAQLRNGALRQQVIDWTNDLHDFSDTAALITNLDLIITVDTAVAHLVGALGKPFWLMNCYNTCWRWLLDRDDSPWYPTARLFRQDATRSWDSVIACIHTALLDTVTGAYHEEEIKVADRAKRFQPSATNP
jgi:tetratricopeptide (TPR) repeat protein